MDDKLFEINRYLGLLNYQQNKLKDILFKKQETLTFFKNLLASDLEGKDKYVSSTSGCKKGEHTYDLILIMYSKGEHSHDVCFT